MALLTHGIINSWLLTQGIVNSWHCWQMALLIDDIVINLATRWFHSYFCIVIFDFLKAVLCQFAAYDLLQH